MGDVMISILTDAAMREVTGVETLLREQAELAGPWFDAA